jgi:hypothetical protein
VLTGREIAFKWLMDEVTKATTADLMRAAGFLEFAREVRQGCAKKRRSARRQQREGWRKFVDEPARW